MGFKKEFPCRGVQRCAALRIIALLRFFIALVCVLFIFLGGWEAWEAREESLEKAGVEAGNFAAVLALQMETGAEKISLMLDGLAERVLAGDLETAASRQRLYRLARMRVQTSRDIISIDVFDAEGNRVNAASFPEKSCATNIRTSSLFTHTPAQRHKAYMGKPVFETSIKQWMFPLSRRVLDQDGKLLAVVVVGVSLEHLRANYSRLNIGAKDSLVVVLDSVPLVWRLPSGTDFVQDMPSYKALASLFAKLQALRSGDTARSPMDGEKRLYTMAPLEKFPVTISVGMSLDNILHGWRLSAVRQGILTFSLLACVLLLGKKLLGLLRLLMARENELESAGMQLKSMNAELERLAREDTLTGLANRRTLMEALDMEFARSARYGEPLSLVMVDVDFFKLYNDTYGHVSGDTCLKRVASVLQGVVRRPGDLAARYGGEEFVLLLPGANRDAAMAIAESALQGLRDLRIPHDKSTVGFVTFSAGVHTCEPGGDDTRETVIKRADHALYRAKEGGRNRICLYAGDEEEGKRAVADLERTT